MYNIVFASIFMYDWVYTKKYATYSKHFTTLPRMWQRKKKTTPKTTESKAVVSQSEKEALVTDLKETTKQLWRLPRLMLAPIIWFIAKKYDAIPEERRKQLQKITKEFKENSASAIEHLKWRFQSLARHDKKDTTKKASSSTKKKSTRKKTTKKAPSKSKTTKKSSSTSLKEKITTSSRDTADTVAKKAKSTAKKTVEATKQKIHDSTASETPKAKKSTRSKSTKKKSTTTPKKSTT